MHFALFSSADLSHMKPDFTIWQYVWNLGQRSLHRKWLKECIASNAPLMQALYILWESLLDLTMSCQWINYLSCFHWYVIVPPVARFGIRWGLAFVEARPGDAASSSPCTFVFRVPLVVLENAHVHMSFLYHHMDHMGRISLTFLNDKQSHSRKWQTTQTFFLCKQPTTGFQVKWNGSNEHQSSWLRQVIWVICSQSPHLIFKAHGVPQEGMSGSSDAIKGWAVN